jgi:hypothetical protein
MNLTRLARNTQAAKSFLTSFGTPLVVGLTFLLLFFRRNQLSQYPSQDRTDDLPGLVTGFEFWFSCPDDGNVGTFEPFASGHYFTPL